VNKKSNVKRFRKYFFNVYKLFPGGVALWSSHPPEEQTDRVRIPPGFKKEGNYSCEFKLTLIVNATEKKMKVSPRPPPKKKV
jgi:hypothetical protein